MSLKLAVIMDPIQHIKPRKDTTLGLLNAAQAQGFSIYYLEKTHLSVANGVPLGHAQQLTVALNTKNYYELTPCHTVALTDFDVILMRLDPPFDMDYIYVTYILELAERAGVLVVNKPQSLRDTNEKFIISYFPDCCPPTLISADQAELRDFIRKQEEVVVKPLNLMGGRGIFRLRMQDQNVNAALELLTDNGQRLIMAQTYLPAIKQGDKRIILIDGNPVPFALARIPAPGELRGNLAAGGQGESRPLTARDREICAQLKPWLQSNGLYLVGIDVIGDYLTEINVTSPTCIRELERDNNLNICDEFIDLIKRKLTKF